MDGPTRAADDAHEGASDAFDLAQPLELPPISERDVHAEPLLDAERAVTDADREANVEAQIATRLALVDELLARHAITPALDALRVAERLDPKRVEVLERLARTLPRAALLRDAAATRRQIARLKPTAANLHATACAWLRTDDHAEAIQAIDELTRAVPDDPRTASLLVTFARLRTGATQGGRVVATLLECAAHARRRDDRERWREHALNAWIESRGTEGGESLAEALAATGRPRAAVYVAAEAAARAHGAAPPDVETAARLLTRSARLAESAGLPGEAAAAWTVHALLPASTAQDARESLRDTLAEQGRTVELAARLRADARRAPTGARSAAWKGVAAIEIASAPTAAAFALAEALRHQPDDVEASELLTSLAADPTVAPSVRDALWGVVRDASLDPVAQGRLLVWLAELEESAGDLAAAEACLAAIADPAPDVFEAISRVHAEAERITAEAERALDRLERATGAAADVAFDELVKLTATRPGALRDARRVGRLVGARALRDERASTLWLRVVRRCEDGAQRDAALLRLSTRAEQSAVRVRAAIERAETLDARGDLGAAVDLLALLLDEMPGDLALASTLAALAEHANDPVLARDALRAVAQATTDAWQRELLTRFTGSADGIFAVFVASLSDPAPSRQRCDDLARMHDLVGDSTALLALRTRALMAQPGAISQALEVSRRFAAFAPLSPEATIAWFGAANVAADAAQIADAAVAVVRSLASVRDVCAVARTALARLGALGADERARLVALEAAGAVGLGDRALRASVLELLRRVQDTPETLPLVEHLAATSSPDDAVATLRTLAEGYLHRGDVAMELSALWRLRTFAREHTTERLLVALRRVGDHARLARVMLEAIPEALDGAALRERLLAVAVEFAAASPPEHAEVVACIDRIVQDRRSDEAQGFAVRALVALGEADAAHGRLMRWAAECAAEEGAVRRMRCATTLARDVMRAPTRALTTLRALLRRVPGDEDALAMAEDVAVASGAYDTIFAIYNDLSHGAAGEHARHAIAYRRACLLERAGRVGEALDEQFALFMKEPSLGASFSAVERLAERSGRRDVLVRALGLLGATSSTPEVRARYFLQASEVARPTDRQLALLLELLSFQGARVASTEATLRRHASELHREAPEAARVAIETLIDDALAAAAQTWDDNARRAHALHALELSLLDQPDAARAAEAAELFLKQHDDPATAERVVRDLVECNVPPSDVRLAVLSLLPSYTNPPERPSSVPLATRNTLRPPTRPSMRPAVRSEPPPPTPSDRPPSTPPRVSRASTRPPKLAFNPRAAMQAGYPVRSATPLFTPAGSSPPPRASQRPASPTFRPPERPSTDRPPPMRTGSSSPPSIELVDGSPAPEVSLDFEEHAYVDRTSSPSFDELDVIALSTPAAPIPSQPPPVPDAATRPRVQMTVSALREAAAAGDDGAARALAKHLAQSDDTRDEALLLQRRRFEQDPSRLDALDALVGIYNDLRMRNESAALASVLAVLSGTALDPWPEAPPMVDVADALEGVAKVLLPPQHGPYPELGVIVWEALNGGRRDATRSQNGLSNERTFASPPTAFGKMFSAAVRLLQLPKSTPMVLRTDMPDGIDMAAGSTPPTVLVATSIAHDSPRARFLVGVTLESTRTCHLPMTALGSADGERLVAAVRAAFGTEAPGKLDAPVARLATRLFDAVPPRQHRHVQDLVAQLGAKLTWSAWRETVAHAQMHAGMLVCADFRVAAESILRGAPPTVSRSPREALDVYPPLRALARFAVSEEYLLLRWQRARW